MENVCLQHPPAKGTYTFTCPLGHHAVAQHNRIAAVQTDINRPIAFQSQTVMGCHPVSAAATVEMYTQRPCKIYLLLLCLVKISMLHSHRFLRQHSCQQTYDMTRHLQTQA